MANQTVREQRKQLFDVDEQDQLSPFVLLGPDGREVPCGDTAREQRAFLYEIDEQDEPSKYALESRVIEIGEPDCLNFIHCGAQAADGGTHCRPCRIARLVNLGADDDGEEFFPMSDEAMAAAQARAAREPLYDPFADEKPMAMPIAA